MDWGKLLERFWPILVNILIIMFCSLGVVYMYGRMLFPKAKDHSKNVIAFVSLILFSYGIAIVWPYQALLSGGGSWITWIQYSVESLLYTAASAVFYITVGWRFYSRVDAYLDKKFAKDNRRKK